MTKASEIKSGPVGPYLIATEQVRGRRPLKGRTFYRFWCHGCDEQHHFECPPWTWNEDPSSPTFSPRLDNIRCICWLQEGKLTYSKRSYHHLAGKVVDLEPSENW